jgi:hypothetical protein
MSPWVREAPGENCVTGVLFFWASSFILLIKLDSIVSKEPEGQNTKNIVLLLAVPSLTIASSFKISPDQLLAGKIIRKALWKTNCPRIVVMLGSDTSDPFHLFKICANGYTYRSDASNSRFRGTAIVQI